MLAGTGTGASAAGTQSHGSSNPLRQLRLYAAPGTSAALAASTASVTVRRKLAILVKTPQAQWFGDWNSRRTVRSAVHRYVRAAQLASAEPVLVTYAIPHRDCGSYSAGGFGSAAAYRSWTRQVAAGIGRLRAAVIIEPDALASMTCLTRAQQKQRLALLRYAVRTLARRHTTTVYIDGGNSGWLPARVLAHRLRQVDVAKARGFSLNVSNFYRTSTEDRYGERVSALLKGKHYVVDTSRNGRGPAKSGSASWCNPSGRGLGALPTARTRAKHADAYLWIKHPGESDGTCRSGPAAGNWYQKYALGLIARRAR
ncbi:glycoside hydrolase family 6 protein [uncultured Jatrophihabitans sp.]|uniref:glycoside hydrolase family 6 protein n=1 Tax=uncultured Jatrophihabitans sp. TaxID=1610747 RepID=UPI0035CC94C4